MRKPYGYLWLLIIGVFSLNAPVLAQNSYSIADCSAEDALRSVDSALNQSSVSDVSDSDSHNRVVPPTIALTATTALMHIATSTVSVDVMPRNNEPQTSQERDCNVMRSCNNEMPKKERVGKNGFVAKNLSRDKDCQQKHATDNPASVASSAQDMRPWYERTHSYLSSYADSPAIWFDRFFVDEELGESILHEPSMRWQLWSVNEYDSRLGESVDVKLRARVDLPKLEAWAQRHIDTSIKQRFQLVINDTADGAAAASDIQTDEDDDNSLIDDEERRFSSALRWLLQKDTSFLSIDVGARSSHVFVQQTIAKNGRLGKRWFAHAEQSFRWRSDDGLDAYLLGTFERRLSPDWVLKQSNQMRSKEPFENTTISHAVELYQQLNQESALRYTLSGSWGVAHQDLSSSAKWSSVFSSVRYRHQLYSNWLFVELEPFVRWTREVDMERSAGGFLRFEVVFARDL